MADTFAGAPNVNGQSFTTMGNIALSEGATLNVSGEAAGGDAAGTVIIRGGQLMMTNATISADTGDGAGATTAVSIQLTGDLAIETDLNPAITARSLGSGDAGEVGILSKNMNVVGTTTAFTEELKFVTVIDTVSWNKGHAGNVNITTGDLQMRGNSGAEGLVIFVDGGVGGEGSGGKIEINANSLNMKSGHLRTGGNFLSENPLGPAGDVKIVSNHIDLQGSTISTQSFANKGGNINIHGSNITFGGSSVLSTTGFTQSGAININAERLLVKEDSVIESNTLSGALDPVPSGGIDLMADVIELKEGGRLITATIGNSDAGPIHLVGADSISLSGSEPISDRPSGIFSSSLGFRGPHGKAGNVFITTPELEINDGARIITGTASQGVGGDITINAQSIIINGQQFEEPAEGLFGLGHPLASGIYTSTLGNPIRCGGTCGNAGEINITTGSFMLQNGAQIDSGTSSTGQGNSIILKASENISISGTLIDGTSGGIFSRSIDPGSGKGGDVSLTAGQTFLLKDGAAVSASSEGPGNAGNINIIGHDTILIDKATVTTEAAQASGGNITLTANDMIQLVDSTISSSVQGDEKTGGGDINLDPDFIILQNSQILAKAVAGKGGNIDLVASKAVLLDAQSTLNASSKTGISGSVTIESPIQVLSGTIAPLPSTPVNVSTLYASPCVAGEGGHFSTFVDSKSDSVAPTPGTFLASPFLPQVSSSPAGGLSHPDSPFGVSGKDQAPPLQMAAYSPPVLFGQGDGNNSACP